MNEQVKVCLPWSYENVQYKNGDWIWSGCQTITEVCATWGNTKFPWFMADWKWSQCSSSVGPPQPCAIWSKTGVLWKNADWRWSECSSSVPVVSIGGNRPGVDANTLIQPWIEEPWNPYRAADEEWKRKQQKRLIKMICKVKGQEYAQEKLHQVLNVSVGSIKVVMTQDKNIDLEVKE